MPDSFSISHTSAPHWTTEFAFRQMIAHKQDVLNDTSHEIYSNRLIHIVNRLHNIGVDTLKQLTPEKVIELTRDHADQPPHERKLYELLYLLCGFLMDSQLLSGTYRLARSDGSDPEPLNNAEKHTIRLLPGDLGRILSPIWALSACYFTPRVIQNLDVGDVDFSALRVSGRPITQATGHALGTLIQEMSRKHEVYPSTPLIWKRSSDRRFSDLHKAIAVRLRRMQGLQQVTWLRLRATPYTLYD